MASDAEEAFAAAWAATGAPRPVREYRFHPVRKWRFDMAWPAVKLAVEIDGRGRHQTVVGVRRDTEKINEAIKLGWRVLRFPATDYKPSRSRPQWPNGAADWARDVREILCQSS